MSPFEDKLRRALRAPVPSADLTPKVLARAAQAGPLRRDVRQYLKIAAAIGVAAVLTGTGFHYERQREERIANERARDQVLEAFRLAEQQLKPFRKSLEAMQTITISIPQGEPKGDPGGEKNK